MESHHRRAVYAGSFDPPTTGHLWMIRHAQAMFDELVVAIGTNPEKQATYTLEERTAMLEDITAEFPNVRVTHFHDSIQADFVVRGIRSGADYEYERAMRYINADLQPAITTVILMPPREFAEVSSTMVKGMVGPQNWQKTIRRYVPDAVYRKILADHGCSAED